MLNQLVIYYSEFCTSIKNKLKNSSCFFSNKFNIFLESVFIINFSDEISNEIIIGKCTKHAYLCSPISVDSFSRTRLK